MRAVPVAVLAVGMMAVMTACDATSSTGATPSSPPALDAQLVPAAQVGPGIRVEQVQGGHSVAGQVTLDLCRSTYPSEAMRTARVQVNFVDPSIGGRVAASEELVRYAPGGAGRAFTELRTATSQCPASYQTAGTAPVTISHVTVEPTDARLVPSQVTVSMMVAIPGGGTVWSASVYQFAGDQLTAIYTGRPDRATAVGEARALAVLAAARLRAAYGG